MFPINSGMSMMKVATLAGDAVAFQVFEETVVKEMIFFFIATLTKVLKWYGVCG